MPFCNIILVKGPTTRYKPEAEAKLNICTCNKMKINNRELFSEMSYIHYVQIKKLLFLNQDKSLLGVNLMCVIAQEVGTSGFCL